MLADEKDRKGGAFSLRRVGSFHWDNINTSWNWRYRLSDLSLSTSGWARWETACCLSMVGPGCCDGECLSWGLSSWGPCYDDKLSCCCGAWLCWQLSCCVVLRSRSLVVGRRRHAHSGLRSPCRDVRSTYRPAKYDPCVNASTICLFHISLFVMMIGVGWKAWRSFAEV